MLEIYMGKSDKMYVDDSYDFLKERLDNIIVYARLLGYRFGFFIRSNVNKQIECYTYDFLKDKLYFSINFEVNENLEMVWFYLSFDDTYKGKYKGVQWLTKLLDKLSYEIGKEIEDEAYNA